MPKYFLLFLGKGRCGSSLCAGLINCHPNAVVLNQKEFIDFEFQTQKQLFDFILESVDDNQYIWPQYKKDDHYWIRHYEKLKIIGTKRQGTLVKSFSDFQRLDELKSKLKIPIKFIHVHRNPYDNIATIFNETQKPKLVRLGQNMKSINRAINYYFSGIEMAHAVMKREDSLNVKHEDLVRDTRKTLTNILTFLELPIIESHMEFCESLVWDNPRKTRESVDWTKKQKQKVERSKNSYNFLKPYKWSD